MSPLADGTFSLTLTGDRLRAMGRDDNGTYTVAVRATNAEYSAFASTRYTVTDVKPVVTITADPATLVGTIPQPDIGQALRLTLSANDPSTQDTITGWRVDWGDGSAKEIFGASVREINHAYARAGTFTITVQAFDKDNALVDRDGVGGIGTLVVKPTPKVTTVNNSATGPSVQLAEATIVQGQSAVLNATIAGTPTAIQWYINGVLRSEVSGTNPSITWEKLSQYDIGKNAPTQLERAAGQQTYAIKVVAIYGTDKVEASSNLIVRNAPPLLGTVTATRGEERASSDDKRVMVTISGSSDPSSLDSNSLTYLYDLNNDGRWDSYGADSGYWANGKAGSNVLVLPRTLFNAPTTWYDQSGSFVARVGVRDAFGAETVGYVTIFIDDVKPTITAAPVAGAITTVQEGETFRLSLSSSDPAGTTRNGKADSILGWTIDWGDGTVTTLGAQNTVPSVSHVYENDNRAIVNGVRSGPAIPYVIRVTAFDTEGGPYAAAPLNVMVTNAAPVLSNVRIFGDGGLENAPINEGGSVRLTGSIADLGLRDSRVLSVDWGDGVSRSYALAANDRSFDLSYTYAQDSGASIYRVVVKAVDSDGTSSASVTKTQTVNNVAPALAIALSQPDVNVGDTLTITGTITDVGLRDTFTIKVDFGNGRGEVLVPSSAITTDAIGQRRFTVSTTYSAPVASATISVSVSDEAGGRATAAATVRVSAQPVAFTLLAINGNTVKGAGAIGTGSDPTAMLPLSGGTVTYVGAFYDPTYNPADPNRTKLSIDWGDGTTSTPVIGWSDTIPLASRQVGWVGFTATKTYGSLAPSATDPFTAKIEQTGTDPVSFALTDSYLLVKKVTLSATDRFGTITTQVTDVAAADPRPRITAFVVPTTALNEGDALTVSGTVVDGQLAQTPTVEIDWGDGTKSAAVVTPGVLGSGGTSRAYTFTATRIAGDNGANGQPLRITATAVDSDGYRATASKQVNVSNVAPQVTLTVPVTVDEGGSFVLNGRVVDPGTAEAITVSIDWGGVRSIATAVRDTVSGDYLFSAGAPADAFTDGAGTIATPDIKTIRVTVLDKDGGSATTTAAVNVLNVAPVVATLTVPTTLDLTGIATITGRLVDAGLNDTLTVTVDWGDGSPATAAFIDQVTRTFSATKTYAVIDPRVLLRDFYEVKVTATDSGGASSSTVVRKIDLRSLLPEIGSVILTAGREGADAQDGGFATVEVRASSPVVSTATLTYNIDLNNDDVWDLPVWQSSPLFTIADAAFHAESGFRAIQIAVRDRDGNTAETSRTVTITDVAPTLTATARNAQIVEGGQVTLDLRATDPSTTDAIQSWTVDWGDGNQDTYTSANTADYGLGRSLTVSHVYADDRRALVNGVRTGPSLAYSIRTTAVDSEARTVAAQPIEVMVGNASPSLSNVALAGTITEGGTARLTGAFADVGVKDGRVVTIDWGDGSALQVVNFIASATSFDVTHTYLQDSRAQAGNAYSVKVSLADTDGASASPCRSGRSSRTQHRGSCRSRPTRRQLTRAKPSLSVAASQTMAARMSCAWISRSAMVPSAS